MADLPPPDPTSPSSAPLEDDVTVEADGVEPSPPPPPLAASVPTRDPEVVKPRSVGLIGKERSVHGLLGGGKAADVLLWRDKKASAVVLCGATAIWIVFDVLDYHLLTLVCHLLISALGIFFLWSKASTFINKAPPRIPEINIPEKLAVDVAHALRNDINRGLANLREIALGRDLKKFLVVIAALWVLGSIGEWFPLLTLLYLVTVALHTLPLFYEKYRDHVDRAADMAAVEIKKHYETVNAQVLSKIPRGPAKEKKME